MPNFIYDIIPPGIKRKAEATIQEVSRWFKIFKLFLKTSKYGTIILIIGIVAFGALLVWAFSPETETIEIFPTQYETEADSNISWQNGEKALQKEFDKNATLADFSSENSAVLFEETSSNNLVPDNLVPETLGTESENLEELKQPEEESKTTEPFIEEPAIEEPTIEEPVIEESETTPSENLKENLIIFRDLFKVAIGGDPEEENIGETEHNVLEAIEPAEQPVEQETEQTEQAPEEITEKPVEEPASQEAEPAVLGEELEQLEEDVASDADDLLRLIEKIEETPSINQPSLINHSIIFSGFNTTPVGELISVKFNFSFAAEPRGEKDVLVIDYKLSEEGEWATLMLTKLDKEQSNSLNNGYWQEQIPDIVSWDELNNLKIRFTILTADFDSNSSAYLDAVWLEVECIKPENGEVLGVKSIEDEYDFELLSNKKDFKINDNLEFKFYIKKKQKTNILLNLISSEGTVNIKTEVLDSGNRVTNEFNPQVQNQGNDEFDVVLNKNNFYRFKPGKYKLKIEIENSDGIFAGEQEFTFGVLAINTNKSIYLSGETAYLQMAALRDDGHTICDANLKLEIAPPNGGLSSVTVQKSGECGPNNVVDVPDYFVYYQVNGAGAYQMKLKNLDTGYEIIDSFEVREEVSFDVERIGPTRIYPLASYGMTLKIKANQDFIGEVIEIVPDSFVIIETSDKKEEINNGQKLIIWQVDWKAGEIYELKYEFDALDISPYLYLLGPLKISDFQEIRQWQIASDTVANLILLWDDAVLDAPAGWTCISCTAGQDFYQKFIRGNSAYGNPLGSTTHTHGSPTVTGGGYTALQAGGSSGGAVALPGTHSDHTSSVVAAGLQGTNLPLYRYLKVIRYDNGIPSTLPAGVIAIFDDTQPLGWTAIYNDSRYIYGYNTANVGGTGGAASNTHSHTLSLSSPSGATSTSTAGAKPGTLGYVAAASHTHTITNTGATGNASPDNQPPYMTVILAKKDAAGAIPQNMIGMFDNTPPVANWTVNSGSGQAFYTRMFKPTGTYGASSDNSTHTHTGTTIVSNGDAATYQYKNAVTSAYYCLTTHTHTFTVGALNSQSHLPPYRDAIFAKAGSTPTPNLTQIHYHWRNDYNNEADATSATSGTEDTSFDTFSASQNKRLRLEISNEGGAASESVGFLLEYGLKETTCGAISTWVDLGAGGGDWDMFPTDNLTDGNNTTDIIDSNKGAVSNANPTFKSSNAGVKDTSSLVAAMALTYEDYVEMEFSIKPNVTSGTYCFRVTDGGSTTNFTYSVYPETTVLANQAPTINEVSLNSKGVINLIENSQVDIMASASVYDPDGCANISGVKAIVYRYPTYTASCSEDPFNPNNCYGEDQFNCVADGACSGNTQNYNCYASSSMQFFADPTAGGTSYADDQWVVTAIASDSAWQDITSSSFDDVGDTIVEVNELTALEVTFGSPISYGEVIVGQDTGSTNKTTTVRNTGNRGIDVNLSGTNLAGALCGGTITMDNQEYKNTTPFSWGSGTDLTDLDVRYMNGSVSWAKPTSVTPITNNIYWGIGVPLGMAPGTCSGTNYFTAEKDN